MTVEEMEAGANAVHALAEKYNVKFFISREQEREIASVVIRAFLAVRGEK